jgi:hypothetical protein
MQPLVSPIKNLLSILLALGLLFSFGLHAVQIQHTHFTVAPEHSPHNHGEEKEASGITMLEVAMHLADKKLLLFLVTGLILLTPFLNERRILLSLLLFALRSASNSYKRHGHQFRMHDYLSLFLRKGIFHSKAY